MSWVIPMILTFIYGLIFREFVHGRYEKQIGQPLSWAEIMVVSLSWWFWFIAVLLTITITWSIWALIVYGG